ncbi:MAG: NADH-quinone oxidoreductase subunit L, partial [bacterium]
AGEGSKNVTKDSPLTMLIPMVTLAALCIFFGVHNSYPIRTYFEPVLGSSLGANHFSGMPQNITLIIGTIVVLILAYINHMYGFKKYGAGIKAVDHIHHAPVLNTIYDLAEKKYFDPYNIGLKFVYGFARVSFSVDRAIDWIYNRFTVKTTESVTNGIKRAHTGNFSHYIAWALGGMIIVVILILRTVK